MPALLLLLGVGAAITLARPSFAASAFVTSYRLQAMQWQMHMMAAGYQCGYAPTELKDFPNEPPTDVVLAYRQKYEHAPGTFVQLLKITSEPGKPFTERSIVLYDSGGPRNPPGVCAPGPRVSGLVPPVRPAESGKAGWAA